MVKIYPLKSCTGCGVCVNSCPMDVIAIDEKSKKAIVKYPEDCMLCGNCVIDCPQKIIALTKEKIPLPPLSWL
ncbi:MAG: 4Fe-4S dicluster domain-containing protein [Candidatus Bathyarchaeia archaeon]